MRVYLPIYFLTAFAIGSILTPVMGRIAFRLGITASPDPEVPGHTRRIPLLGGGPLIACLGPAVTSCALRDFRWASVGLAASIIVTLGLYKDCVGRPVSALFQLILQCAAIVILIAIFDPLPLTADLRINIALSIIGCAWILNGWNFLDVMDGLAPGVAAITCGFFVLFNLHIAQIETAVLSITIAGCMAGFLIHNYPPASIFLGDLGSFTLGLFFCCFLLNGVSNTYPNTLYAFILLLLLPLFEVAATSFSRIIAGRSPLKGCTHDHLSIRLSSRGWRPQTVIRYAYLCSIITDLAGYGLLRALTSPG